MHMNMGDTQTRLGTTTARKVLVKSGKKEREKNPINEMSCYRFCQYDLMTER